MGIKFHAPHPTTRKWKRKSDIPKKYLAKYKVHKREDGYYYLGTR